MTDPQVNFVSIRRIVAGHDPSKKAVVIHDRAAEKSRDQDNRRSTLIWATKETPAGFLDLDDAGLWDLGTPPPPGGTRFCIIQSLPGARYPAMHRTDTVDYVICIAGEITMDLDDSTVVLRAGDVLVQLGTNHGWRNETDSLAIVAFVLVDGNPKPTPTYQRRAPDPAGPISL